jgi:hypothetical protein
MQMTSTPHQSISPSRAVEPNADEMRRLRLDLARMTTYAQALEQRCNRLWTYVPDTHGTSDPVVPFVARHFEVGVEQPADLG